MFRSFLVVSIVVSSAIAVTTGEPSRAHAQAEEASILFERGNQHLARGMRARGRTRARELEQALEAYQGVLRLGTRTRNVVFNTALTLGELGRPMEAFNYYSEYLRAFDLSEDERAEGTRRIDAIRPEVAVLAITSAPPGATVRIDRSDLPVRGTTPIELAVSAGEHPIFFSLSGFTDTTIRATAVVGQTVQAQGALTGAPVQVQVIAPRGGTLTLDDQPIEAGRAIAVPPGPHVVRLEMPGLPPVERQFEVSAGDAPIRLELAAPAGIAGPQLAMRIDTPATVFVDQFRVGSGQELAFPIAPGPHMIRVEAPGHRTATHVMTIGDNDRPSLEVDLALEPDPTALYAVRTLFAVLAFGGIGTGIGALAWAAQTRGEWETAVEENGGGSQALFDELTTALLATDLSWSITAGVGLVAIITLFVDPGGGEESSVRLVSAPGGLALAWRTP
jgi:outer membrane receptor for ferrienterochelin and colicins